MTRPGSVVDSHRRPLSWVSWRRASSRTWAWWLRWDWPDLTWTCRFRGGWCRPRRPCSTRSSSSSWCVRDRLRHCAAARFCCGPSICSSACSPSPSSRCSMSQGTSEDEWSFPPAPLPELLWVPGHLVPLRDLLRCGQRAVRPIPSPWRVAERCPRRGRRRSRRRCHGPDRSKSPRMPRSRSASRSSTSRARLRRALLAPPSRPG